MLRFVVARDHKYTLESLARRPLRLRVSGYDRVLDARLRVLRA